MRALIIILLTLTTSLTQAQLSPMAQALKNDKNPESIALYQSIRNYAIETWEDDHSMIVEQINQNVDAYLNLVIGDINEQLIDAGNNGRKIFNQALKNWVHPSDEAKFNALGSEYAIMGSWEEGRPLADVFILMIDWPMVEEECRQQLESLNAY